MGAGPDRGGEDAEGPQEGGAPIRSGPHEEGTRRGRRARWGEAPIVEFFE